MPSINSPEIDQQFRETLNIQSVEGGLRGISNAVTPVFMVNPLRATVIKSGGQATSGSITLFTTPAASEQRTFYLTYAHINLSKDSTNDNGGSGISITVGGKAINVISTNYTNTTLTAKDEHIEFQPKFPIKIDPGTNITCTGTFTVGNLRRDAVIAGFII